MRTYSPLADMAHRFNASVLATLAAIAASAALHVQAQQTGSSTYTMGAPLGAATATSPWTWTLPVPDPNRPGRSKTVNVNVQPIAAYNPRTETFAQASARKAQAVKDAIDGLVAAGTLPNTVTVATNQTQVPQPTGRLVWNPVLRRFVPEIAMVPGPTQVTIAGVSGAVGALNDPTRQAGNGVNFQPGGGNPVQPGPSYRPSMGGSSSSGGGSSSSGYSTGYDPLGNPSVLGFGFYDSNDTDPELLVAAILPSPGMSSAEALGELADTFNELYGSMGFSARYDSSVDRLMLDQELDWSETFWFANSDAGLDFGFELTPVPEPSALALALLGTLGAVLAARRWRQG